MRTLLRVIIVLVILGAAGAFFSGYWSTGRISKNTGLDRPNGTAGKRATTATERVRERATELGERTGEVAGQAAVEARDAISDAGLTAKIKSKMALDDMVGARNIDVDTTDRVVTLRGTVGSAQERERAVRLARETAGVVSVKDQLQVH